MKLEVLGCRLVRIAGTMLVTGVLVAGCGQAEAPSSSPVSLSGDFAGLVQIGEGRTMYLECSGTGSPTVILISGNGTAADGWQYSGGPDTDEANPPTRNDAAVYPSTARFTRVCAYDRPGTLLMDGGRSRSSSVTQPTTPAADAADLHRLMTAAAIPGPYVLVGHSLGGFIATIYARTYPVEVTGIVLVDAASEYVERTLGPKAFAQWAKAFMSKLPSHPEGEAPDMVAGVTAINALPAIPPMPASVLSAEAWPFAFPTDDGQADHNFWPEWFEAQELLAAALHATHITHTHSGHNIFIENAALVNEQICRIVVRSRAVERDSLSGGIQAADSPWCEFR